MKINSDTIWILIIGTLTCSPFLFFGVWSMFFFKGLTVLQCERLEPHQVGCQLTAMGLLSSQTTQISNLKKAGSVTYGSKDRKGYHIVLTDSDYQKIFFSNRSKSDYDAVRVKVNKINSFINNPQQYTLTMRDDNRWFSLIGGVVILICGGMIVCCTMPNKFK